MKKGTIILLNGVSSSGKTTLAKALRERLTEPYYYFGLDTFIDMSPVRCFSEPDGRAKVNRAVSILPHTIKLFSDNGLNTIIDHVFLKTDNLFNEFVEVLHDYPVLFVHVTCPLEENLRRAKERGSNPNIIKSQIPLLIPQNTYDLVVDTTKENCIEEIMALLNEQEKFTALKSIWTQKI